MFLSGKLLSRANLKYSTLAQAIHPLQEASLNENCILVNKLDEPTGFASKRDCHRVGEDGNLKLHRAFSVFMFNTKNELILHKRSAKKVTFPNYVTNTCCSHPLYDIPSERLGVSGVKEAARRRLEHELGIPKTLITPNDLYYMMRVLYKSTGDGIWGEHEMDYILVLIKDLPILPNPEEVSEIYNVKKEDVDTFLANLKDPVSPWFMHVLKNGLRNWWDNLDSLHKFQDHKNVKDFTN